MKTMTGAFLLLALLAGLGLADTGPVRFQHLTINEGLPENSIRAILQDRHGFIWFGTQNGLARYDGTDMVVHLPDPDDPGSIGIRTLLALAEDADGGIWVGSYSAGVSRYDPVTDTFTNFAAEGDSLPGPGVPTIVTRDDGTWFTTGVGGLHRWRDGAFERLRVEPFEIVEPQGLTGLEISEREIWVGSGRAGIAVQDRADGSWRHLFHDPEDPESLPSDYVTFIHRDSGGRLWVGGRDGLGLHKGDGRFTVFKPRPDLGQSEPNYLVCIAEDPDGTFWIGAAVGLYHFDPATGDFILYAHDPDVPWSPVRGPVLSLLCDASGIVWAGSWHTGLNKYDPGSRKFDVHLHDPDRPGSLDDDAIGAVFEDSRGNLWVGTGSRSSGGTQGGLNRRLPGSKEFSQLPFPEMGGVRVRTVTAITEDRLGTIWLGTSQGVWQVDPACDCIVRPPQTPTMPSDIFDGSIQDVLVDGADRIWVASWMGGLHRYDPLAGAWRTYRADPDDLRSLPSNDVTTIGQDGRGRLWIGTDSGNLTLFDPDADAFRHLDRLDAGLETVFRIIPADGGRMWVSSGSGLLLCEPDSVIATYSTRNGLPSDETGRILLDGNGHLWSSTGLGLARIKTGTGEVTVFDERDGLPRNEVHFAAGLTRSGRIFFGGHHGLVSFHPDRLRSSTFVPPVHLTQILIRDEPLAVGPDSPLDRSLQDTAEIRLGPGQNDLAFSFAALDYAHPERNRYRFKLEPYDAEWRSSTGRRTAQYTNLDPGTYEFAVMGSNRDGLWNETPRTLRIHIAPPWWRTAWANVIYVAVFLLLIGATYRLLLNRERTHMALEIERAEAHHLQELDQLKSRFFANISHEFRTPLTLLSSPLRRLQEDPQSGNAELFGTMARNARRLGRLIDQLLDLSRLEADRMPSRWRHGDWLKFLRAMVSPFTTLAEQRNVVLTMNWPASEPRAVWYDQDLLEKILVNLLSNALKFTPTGGEVTLTVTVADTPAPHPWPGQSSAQEERHDALLMTARVRNTGSHIPPEELEHVFDRFHQVDESADHGDLGSGIGLALVKELADWCGGQVKVSSDRQEGTTFAVVLPLFLSAPAGIAAVPDEPVATVELDEDLADAPADEEEESADTGLPTVLIAEDNADLRTYVRDELSDEFNMLVAANGKTGLELARKEIPDLVLSDIMMPEMDGLELCKALKSDDLTNHVPVIILTAKAEAESRREGLETGADDYVAKPFDVEELRIRIRNLVAQRKLLAERYAQLEVARPGRAANPVPSADDRFLARVREIIAANLEDADFRVEALCREIGMSRTQLHRKLTAVAGRSAGGFLRMERLNRAAEMLGRAETNVTEVAYSVGYRSLSQFAKAFREQFGVAPSDFEA